MEDSRPLKDVGPVLACGAICAGILVGVFKLFDLL